MSVEVHHTSLALSQCRGSDEEGFGDLNFRRAEILTDLVAMFPGKDVPSLDDDDLVLRKGCCGKQTASVNRTRSLFDLGEK